MLLYWQYLSTRGSFRVLSWAPQLLLLATRWLGSLALPNQNSTATPSMMTAYTWGTTAQPKATIRAGATNLLTAAPELPAPNTPMAKPCWCLGNQLLNEGVPTENTPPAKPTNRPRTRNCQY